jgi:hypothetical protein
VVKFSHDWLPIEYANDDAVLTDMARKMRRPFLICTAASPGTVAKTVSDSSQVHLETDTAADIRCTNQKGIENWLTGDTNDPDSIETVAQIGWFQVLKYSEEWTLRQESILSPTSARSIPQVSSGPNSLSFSGHTATHFERAQSYTHLEKTAQTTPALAPKQPATRVDMACASTC